MTAKSPQPGCECESWNSVSKKWFTLTHNKRLNFVTAFDREGLGEDGKEGSLPVDVHYIK